MMDKFGFKASFVVIDDGQLSDSLYVQFHPNMTSILIVISQPECDAPSFVFDARSVSTWGYIQTWFRKHSLYEHTKTIELFYPSLNISEKIKLTRENLDRLFGRDFLAHDLVDQNYINNLHYIED
jgi:hypothetical protein